MKLCNIYNFAPHYRTSIFTLIDQTFDCDWYFGNSNEDIKKMDYSLLKGKVEESNRRHLIGGLVWQNNVVRLIGRKEYDTYLLLGQTKDLSTWIFCILARLFYPQKKVYFWSHGFYGKESRIQRLIKKALFKMPNGGVFLYGNYARELMIKTGFNPDKLFVIHNSLDYDKQLEIRKYLVKKPIYKEHFENDNPNLFFVGRLTKVKKLDMVLRAMAQLRDKGQMYNMTFIGDGTECEVLKVLSQELKLEQNVWFYGACYDEKLLGEMIYNADLCLAPGNIGLTAMHTMVFGTPALTHNAFSHQMPEFEAIHDGETGTFYQYGSVDSLVESISRWFAEKTNKREEVRCSCMQEIDSSWTPKFQIEILKKMSL